MEEGSREVPLAWERAIAFMILTLLVFAVVLWLGFRRKHLTWRGMGLGALAFGVCLVVLPAAAWALGPWMARTFPTYGPGRTSLGVDLLLTGALGGLAVALGHASPPSYVDGPGCGMRRGRRGAGLSGI